MKTSPYTLPNDKNNKKVINKNKKGERNQETETKFAASHTP